MILERLIVEIDGNLSGLTRELTKAERNVQQSGQKLEALGKKLSLSLTLPLLGAGAAAAKFASDAEEAANKFGVVFGSSVGSANAEIDRLRQTIPAARHELVGLAAGLQDLLKPLGIAEREASKMSIATLELAGDLASFNNVRLDDVLLAIRSGFVGQSEPLLRFGADVRAAAVQSKALELGLIRQGQAMTNAARAQAVLAIVTESNTDAIGDAARTSDSAANSFKFFTAEVKDLGVALGEVLLPVVTPAVQALTEMLRGFQALGPGAQRMAVAIGLVAAAIGPLAIALSAVGAAIVGINVALTSGLLGPILVGAAGVAAGIALIAAELKGVASGIRDVGAASREALPSTKSFSAAVQMGPAELEGLTVTGLRRPLPPKFTREAQATARRFGTIPRGLTADELLFGPGGLDLGTNLGILGTRTIARGPVGPAGPGASLQQQRDFGAFGEKLASQGGRLSVSNRFFDDIRKAGVEFQGAVEPLTDGARDAGKAFIDFGRVGDSLKSVLDPTQILSGAAANLLSGGISAAFSVIGDALFGDDYVTALQENTRALRALAGDTSELDDAINALREWGGWDDLIAELEDTRAALLASSRISLARRRIAASDATGADEFSILQDALVSALRGPLAEEVSGLTLETAGPFLEGLLDDIEAGRFSAEGLNGITAEEFLDTLGELESLGDAASSAAEELSGLARTINAPFGFKDAIYRYRATDTGVALGGDTFSAVGTVGKGRGDVHFHGDWHVNGRDGRDLFEDFKRQLRVSRSLGGADEFTDFLGERGL